MMFRLLLSTIVAALLVSVPLRADTSQIHVPDGFVVERVAGPPLVDYPMMAGFDERGRLFVTDNAGVNLHFDELSKAPPSRVLMLEDTDHDGTFDKRTVFADKMVFPSGVVCHDGAVYVCSVPGVWKLEDTNDDGIADRRTQIVTGFGSIGNGADLHGPYLGPEGWLYFCDGRNGHDLTLGDGTKWKGKAAGIYRCKTDGSGLELVCGGGFDNPVEVAFTPEGEPLVNVNLFQSQPHRVDAIIYAIEGSNYPHADVWRELKRTGEFQPSVGDLGWVATSGFMRYRGSSLGPKYAGKYFTTQFNPHRVQAHTVERDGAGFKVTHEDFLTCNNPDFHPTDVLEDADGSLLVVDTGGWFRIGCPNSQIAKPEVKGAIYRVRRSGPHSESIPMAATDGQLAGMRMAELARDPNSAKAFLAGLTDSNLAIRREAATGLGRLRTREAVPALLDAVALSGGDRFLDHAIIYALIQIADRDDTIAGLKHKSLATRRAALIALDQMDGGNLTADLVAVHLASEDPRLRETALAIATAHPQWAEQMAPTIRDALAKGDVAERDAAPLRSAIAGFAQAPAVQAVVAEALGGDSLSPANRVLLLQAVAESGIRPLPDAWAEPVRRSLKATDANVVQQAIEVARTAGGGEAFYANLADVVSDANRPTGLRVAALSVMLPTSKSLDTSAFELLTSELTSEDAPLSRLAAAQALAAAPLIDRQLVRLAELAASVGPLELPALLPCFERSADAFVGTTLIKSLETSKSLKSIPAAALAQSIAKYPPEVQQSAASLLAKINPDGAAQKARLAELEPLLSGGSPNRGQSVFFGKTTACATCHAVRGSGAHVGPDLSKIASIRAPRDLLESLVFPSASFARGYEPYIVQTKSGQTYAGTLAAETSDAIVLRTPAEVRIARASIKTIRQDRVSIMPQGLDAQMSKQDLSDLLAFLQSLK